MIKVFVFILMLTASAAAQIKVSLLVSADNYNNGEIRSYLARELRSLGDVEITDEDPSYVLEVLVASNQIDGYPVQYIFSVVVFKRLDFELHYQSVYDGSASEEHSHFFNNNSDFYFYHWIVAKQDSLKDICVEVINDFNGTALEGFRQRCDHLIKVFEKTLKK